VQRDVLFLLEIVRDVGALAVVELGDRLLHIVGGHIES